MADDVTVRKSDDWYVAHDEQTGVSSQGTTRVSALDNLVEALKLYNDD